ncbi:ABC transporter substrate-binding protein [Methylobacterium currus]|nr:ABC transporter substrate-binding protein [Methylobacterium currus]
MGGLRRMVLGWSLAAAAASGALAAECTSPVKPSDLTKPGSLVMSTNPTLPPMQYVDRSGQLVGMRIELGREIARRLCLTPDYVKIEFPAMIPGLQAGRWDMINTGIFFTPERAKIMQMIPYESQTISIATALKPKVPVTRVEDLDGRTIGVEMGGFEENKAKALNAELKGKGLSGMTIRTFDSYALAYQALRAGHVEAVVSIDAVAKEYADRGEFQRALTGLFPTPVSLAFKNRNLADAVLKVLEAMQEDGSFAALLGRFGVVPVPGRLAVQGPAG